MTNEQKQHFDAAVKKRVRVAIENFVEANPNYRKTAHNRALIEDWLLTHGSVVPSVETLTQGFSELQDELDLTERPAVAAKIISLKDSPGPRVQKVSFGGAF
jgi:hypothetical protein